MRFMEEERPRLLLGMIQSGEALEWIDQYAEMLDGAPNLMEALPVILEQPEEGEEKPLNPKERAALERGVKLLETEAGRL